MSDFQTRVISAAEIIVPSIADKQKEQTEIWNSFQDFYFDLDFVTQKKIKLFSAVLQILCLFYTLKFYTDLDLKKRDMFFSKIYKFPIGLIRSGFFGFRSLILMAQYTRESVQKRIRYAGPLVKRKLK